MFKFDIVINEGGDLVSKGDESGGGARSAANLFSTRAVTMLKSATSYIKLTTFRFFVWAGPMVQSLGV